MKTRGKRKFFKCLEPLGARDGLRKSKRSSFDGTETDDYCFGLGRGCGCGDGGGGGGGGGGADADDIAGFSKIFSSLSDRKFESSNGDFAKDRQDKYRRSFSRVIKAVFFETSLSRKFRKKGWSRPTFMRSNSTNLSPKTEKMTNLLNQKILSKEAWGTDEFLGRSSSLSLDTSLFSSSTMASSSCLSSRSASERKISPLSVCFAEPKQATLNEEASVKEPLVLKQAKPMTAVKEPLVLKQARPMTAATKRYNSNIMCFLVLSLIALVFWGKALAIVCTSAWLYLVPRLSEWMAYSPENDSNAVCKSKVVESPVSEETSLSRRL